MNTNSWQVLLDHDSMNMEFRPVIAKYKEFFGNNQRVARLNKILPPYDIELDLKVEY
ncbi:hypothetical protein [Photobacterium phosphoreum]|uniref:hypothetical protein n=1 Tax=Photobacterium phosphoreum TaxID=659 RepID=UPI0013906087|nr:hypothetical protein [Photobacterium phosphoreum]